MLEINSSLIEIIYIQLRNLLSLIKKRLTKLRMLPLSCAIITSVVKFRKMSVCTSPSTSIVSLGKSQLRDNKKETAGVCSV